MVDGARPADVMLELVFELGAKLTIVAIVLVRGAQLVERLDQRFGDEYAAVRPEMPVLVRKVIHLHRAHLEKMRPSSVRPSRPDGPRHLSLRPLPRVGRGVSHRLRYPD